jgi:hypothetical protein
MIAAVTPLPAPPLVSGLLDGQPWLISGILLFSALAVYQLTRNPAVARSGGLGAAALVFLALALQVLAAAITTPREELTSATRTLVHATAGADTAALSPMLAEDCRLFGPGGIPGLSIPSQGLDKPGTLRRVGETLGGSFRLQSHSIPEVQAELLSATTGRTQVKVHVVFDQSVPANSWWRIGWRKDAGAWRATSIEPLELPYGGGG